MLSTEVRELMVKAYEKSHNATEVARNFSVSRGTVYEYVNRKRKNESIEVKTSQRGRKPKLTQKNLDDIKNAIEEQPDITIHEITEKFALPASEETVRRDVVILILNQPIDKLSAIISSFCVKLPCQATACLRSLFLTELILSVDFVYRTIEN